MHHTESEAFDLSACLAHLAHYLPAQTALKDFVHHNSLHAFQQAPFHEASWQASQILGYKTYLSLAEYRAYYAQGRISEGALERVLAQRSEGADYWKPRLMHATSAGAIKDRLHELRPLWRQHWGLNPDKIIQPLLFRILGAYLDQGISLWAFPGQDLPLLEAVRQLEAGALLSFFKSARARIMLQDRSLGIEALLQRLVGEPRYYQAYLFEQQFAHPGWSGLVASLERQPSSLHSQRPIRLADLVHLELLLELDALYYRHGEAWQPLATYIETPLAPLFAPVQGEELAQVLALWQEAFEWSYYEPVLAAMQQQFQAEPESQAPVSACFQALFCIDDRSYALRRHIEQLDTCAQTYGTPGFFNLAFYFQAAGSSLPSKSCPAPLNPQILIREQHTHCNSHADIHLAKPANGLFRGWLMSNLLGLWSAVKLIRQVWFSPKLSPASAHAASYMACEANLSIAHEGEFWEGYQLGFTLTQMIEAVEGLLRSIGLTEDFAPLVYVIGHGGSSTNNPYYAGYDCGACSGRPGGVNARVLAHIANLPQVREGLRQRGLDLPASTYFIGGLHDTTRDEILFYDEVKLPEALQVLHQSNRRLFERALEANAAERALRFDNLPKAGRSAKALHQAVKQRALALFEPRPEWNHTDNALCLVGRSNLYRGVYLDKRPFLNSYDYRQDPQGRYLAGILGAIVPVCGGINLEYYFSRMDPEKLGAGSKLPHNIVGLIGVNTGLDGDLRPGLPSQMVEIHDPLRLLFIVEQKPEVLLQILRERPALEHWFGRAWLHLVVFEPETGQLYRYVQGRFETYYPGQAPPLKPDCPSNRLAVIRKTEAVLIH